MLRIISVLVVVMGLVACSSSSDEESAPSDCEKAVKVLCEKACECGSDGKCSISDSGATLSHDSLDDCTSFYGLACGSKKEKFSDAECKEALDAAECDADGVVYPSSCNIEH